MYDVGFGSHYVTSLGHLIGSIPNSGIVIC